MRRSSLIGATVAAMSVAVVMACDQPTTNLPTTPSQVAAAGLVISGPDSVAPGQSVQFAANVRMPNGTVKAAANLSNVVWRSSNGSVLQVSASGLATARQPQGEASVIAAMGQFQSTREVVILPNGTFRVVGTVVEADTPGLPVAGARVEVAGTSVAATTDFIGGYRLYGVPAQADILVSANGYLTHQQRLQLTGHTSQQIRLSLDGPRLSLTGPYTLTIDLSSSTCSSLSPELRQRSYDATLAQSGSTIDVVLTEPRFRIIGGKGNRFTGRATSGGATFTLAPYSVYYYYYGLSSYPDVAERLSDGTHLVVSGQVTTSGSAAGLTGALTGGGTRWDSRFPNVAFPLGGCFTGSHQFTLTPR